MSFLRVLEFSFTFFIMKASTLVNIQGKVLEFFFLQKNHLNLLSHLKRILSIASNYLRRNEVLNVHTKSTAMTRSKDVTMHLKNHFFFGKFKIGETKRMPMAHSVKNKKFQNSVLQSKLIVAVLDLNSYAQQNILISWVEMKKKIQCKTTICWKY